MEVKFQSLPEELATGLEREESDKVLLAANSTPISQLGEVVVKVEVGERITSTKMLVSDQVESIILGLNWLTTNKGKIDFESDVLTVMNVEISLHRSTIRTDNCRRIISRQRCHRAAETLKLTLKEK